MLGINKLNISKLKLTSERIEKNGEEKESLCSSRSLDSSSSPCFSMILLPISPMGVSNGVLKYCEDDNGGMDAFFCSQNLAFKDKIKAQKRQNHMRTKKPARPWLPLQLDHGSHHDL